MVIKGSIYKVPPIFHPHASHQDNCHPSYSKPNNLQAKITSTWPPQCPLPSFLGLLTHFPSWFFYFLLLNLFFLSLVVEGQIHCFFFHRYSIWVPHHITTLLGLHITSSLPNSWFHSFHHFARSCTPFLARATNVCSLSHVANRGDLHQPPQHGQSQCTSKCCGVLLQPRKTPSWPRVNKLETEIIRFHCPLVALCSKTFDWGVFWRLRPLLLYF